MADMNHLTGLSGLSADSITGLLDTAAGFKQTLRSPNASFSPTLKNRRIALVFFENSTRTRFSFEIAARNLGAGTLGFSAASSSVSKGETLSDTIKNLEAMQVDAFVLRHPHRAAQNSSAASPRNLSSTPETAQTSIPPRPCSTCSLFGSTSAHSKAEGHHHRRCASQQGCPLKHLRPAEGRCRSRALRPGNTDPPDAEKLGVRLFTDLDHAIAWADTAIVLRLQLERASGTYLPSLEEYSRHYGLTDERLERTGKHLLVLHPGPINREIEISNHVADRIQPPGYSKSMLLEQVTNGIAIRMAVLETLLGGTP